MQLQHRHSLVFMNTKKLPSIEIGNDIQDFNNVGGQENFTIFLSIVQGF